MRKVLAVCAALLAGSAAVTEAAVIESFSGSVNLSISGSVMPLADPRANLTESMAYGLTRRHEVNVPGGGSAAVAYGAIDTAEGALLDICAWTALTLSVPPSENSSVAQVDLSFTTSRELTFTLTAAAENPYYEATFDGFVASLFPDPSAPGGLGGTMGLNRAITFTGVLPAGLHTLAIFTTPAGPRGPAESNYGQFTLALSEASDEVHMNPTPSAVMAGLLLLGAMLLPRRGARHS